jgi:hypothetical protein
MEEAKGENDGETLNTAFEATGLWLVRIALPVGEPDEVVVWLTVGESVSDLLFELVAVCAGDVVAAGVPPVEVDGSAVEEPENVKLRVPVLVNVVEGVDTAVKLFEEDAD